MNPPRKALLELAGLFEARLRARNRVRRRIPHSHGPYWCGCCDAAHVHTGDRCIGCGVRAEAPPIRRREIA